MAAMKKLADFKNEEGIVVASKILPIIIEILSVEKNRESENEKNPLAMFSNFMKNSPAEMKRIFAIISVLALLVCCITPAFATSIGSDQSNFINYFDYYKVNFLRIYSYTSNYFLLYPYNLKVL